MRKFKVKNRQKRKYTKRAPEPVQTAHFFHPSISHVFPSIVLTFGLIITMIVSIPMNQLENMHVAPLSVTMPSINYSAADIKGLTVPAINISAPTLPSIPLSSITKPIGQAATQANTSITNFGQSLYRLSTILFAAIISLMQYAATGLLSVFKFVIFMLQITLRFTLQLIRVLGQYLLITLNFFHQNILRSVAQILYAYQLGFELSTQFIQIIWKGIAILTNAIFSLIQAYTTTMIHRSIRVITWVGTTSLHVLTAISNIIYTIIQTIITWTAALGNLIAQPFIYLFKQVMKLKPAYNYVMNSFAQSSSVLGEGTNNLIELPNNLKK